MRRYLFTFIFLWSASIYTHESTNYITHTKIIDSRACLINAITNVQDPTHDIFAFCPKEQARGILQIRPIMVEEVNRILEKAVFDTTDCYNISKSVAIFTIIQEHYNGLNWFDNPKEVAGLWNGWRNWKTKQSTINYVNCVLSKL